MNNVLVVYNLVPEDQLVFSIPCDQMKPEWFKLLEQASNCIVNGDDMNSGMDWVIQATARQPEDADKNSEHYKDAACLNSYRVELVKGESLAGPFSKVYLTSFWL